MPSVLRGCTAWQDPAPDWTEPPDAAASPGCSVGLPSLSGVTVTDQTALCVTAVL